MNKTFHRRKNKGGRVLFSVFETNLVSLGDDLSLHVCPQGERHSSGFLESTRKAEENYLEVATQ